jgi:biopolymer transport protein ExbD
MVSTSSVTAVVGVVAVAGVRGVTDVAGVAGVVGNVGVVGIVGVVADGASAAALAIPASARDEAAMTWRMLNTVPVIIDVRLMTSLADMPGGRMRRNSRRPQALANSCMQPAPYVDLQLRVGGYMKVSNSRVASISDINMTPLIDVMLVLLIIFIITLPRQTHAIKIDNPVFSMRPPQPHPIVDVSIDFDGTLLWDHRALERSALQNRISAEAAKSPQPEVHLSVDKFAKYEIVAQTLADLQSRGLKSIGFVNREP